MFVKSVFLVAHSNRLSTRLDLRENIGTTRRSRYEGDEYSMIFGRERYISKKSLSIILIGCPDELELGSASLPDSMRYITESTDSNADTTPNVSSADVSMYIMLFSPVTNGNDKRRRGKAPQKLSLSDNVAAKGKSGSERTGKFRGHLSGDGATRSQVRLVSDEHGDYVWACVLAQLFDPGLEVVKGRGLGHVVQQQHAKSSAIEPERYRGSQL